MKRFRKNQKGFTLVETMSVVAIVSMLTAMSLPHFLSLRVGANEAAAQVNLKSLYALMQDYQFAYGSFPGFQAGNKGVIGRFVNDYYGSHPVISNSNNGGGSVNENSYFLFQGYRYDVVSYGNTFIWACGPDRDGITGNRYFKISEDGVVQEMARNESLQWIMLCCSDKGQAASEDPIAGDDWMQQDKNGNGKPDYCEVTNNCPGGAPGGPVGME